MNGTMRMRSEAFLWELPPCPFPTPLPLGRPDKPKWSFSRVHPYFGIALAIGYMRSSCAAVLHVLLQSATQYPGPCKPRSPKLHVPLLYRDVVK